MKADVIDARSRILAAAKDGLVAGAGDIEMKDVARAAGVSVGLAYHYFGSKAGLISALIGDFYDAYDEVVNRRYDKAIPWAERERARLEEAIGFLLTHPLAPVLFGRMSRSAEAVAVEAARREAISELAARNIADGQERGVIPRDINPAIAGAMLIGGTRQAAALALAAAAPPDAAQLTEQLWGLVAGALRLRSTV